jgi:peroxiredoxin
VVVVFTCASCPVAVEYESRISNLARELAEKSVAVVAICVNQVKQDRLDALTKRVEDEKLGFHYLYDESQQIAKDYGAIFTPEFFVLNKDRQVVYMGAFDDAGDPAKVKSRWVPDAVQAALAGEKPATTETLGRGCRVRYARERRKPK